jgi:hypothetical protein
VLGEWCIGTNNSNLKNNEEVKLWSYETESLPNWSAVLWIDDGRSKCGIMFNTGTVIVSANLGLDHNFVPSFSCGAAGFHHLYLLKAFETARLVMAAGMCLTRKEVLF